MQGNALLGIVTRDDVLRALASNPNDVYVTGIMQRDVVKVDGSASIEEVRQIISDRGARVAAVYDGAVYLGLVSIEDISEAFAIITFMRRQQELGRAERASAGS
jgi:CBS domain-containing protein